MPTAKIFSVILVLLQLIHDHESKALSNVSDSLSYTLCSSIGIDSAKLYAGIDSIINQALDSAAFPGCQILLAQGGQVFYHESFGYHTYDSVRSVQNSDIYDLASITKVAASTLALMKLYEEGKFDLDQTLGFYFPWLSKSNKSKLTMRKVLAHQSGLKNWIPYYSEVRKKNGKYRRKSISPDSSAAYPYRIPGSMLFMHADFVEKKIYRLIRKSKLYPEEQYVYSGLVFYLFPELVERLSGMPFDKFLEDSFFSKIDTESIGFRPTDKHELDFIVPTEIDTFFRMNKLHGVVHDEGAALMRGVSGNAGLFGNAFDLAKIFQMLLNEGWYGGQNLLDAKTIAEFTKCQYCEQGNRRGLGFDKPLIEYDSIKASVAKKTSAKSFGHSGYTGTLAWADPEQNLIFIFLSNRVYPTRNNSKIYQLNIRPRIHNLVYDLIEGK